MSGCFSPLSFSALSFNTGTDAPEPSPPASAERTIIAAPRRRMVLAQERVRLIVAAERKRGV